MKRRSIRFRLTAWYALILTAGFALFGGLIWFSLRERLMNEVDEDLGGRASRFEKYFRAEATETSGNHLRAELNEFCQGLAPNSFIDLRGPFPFRFSSTVADLRKFKTTFTLGSEAYELEVGTSVLGVQHTLDLLRLLLLGISPIVILIACAGGAWLSRRALKPVTDITATALTISIENLSDRLPVPATGDELAQLTEVLNTMLARLESAVKTLSQFVADASHEFRTPLAVIRTSAELALRRAREPEEYRATLKDVVAESERMTALVEDLLLLARNDAMPMGPVDLGEVVDAAASQMRNVYGMRRILVSGEAATISGNRAALQRLFLVLVDNALKYSTDDVAVMLDGGSVKVRDSGVGIAEADLPHIFKRFYQADKARSQSGYGLGLSLAETIVRAHGGAIEVSTSPGAGSTFTVIFPSSKLLSASADNVMSIGRAPFSR